VSLRQSEKVCLIAAFRYGSGTPRAELEQFMKFSIITASFNSAKTIEKTLASVQAQTYANVEHIVADGDSKDGTADLVRRLAPEAKLFVAPDKGIYDGMNKGIRQATGDVIVLLNSDDYYAHAGVLANVAEVFATTSADAVFADIAFFDPANPDRNTRHYRSDRFSPSRLKYGIMPAHPGMFLKREIYDSLGLYAEGFPLSADFEFVARMFAKGNPHYVFHNEIAVKMMPGGISTRNFGSKVNIFNECIRACRVNGIQTSVLTMLGKYPIKLLDYVR
jgi:glycosyltransferase involved in cell wall biosynthesis